MLSQPNLTLCLQSFRIVLTGLLPGPCVDHFLLGDSPQTQHFVSVEPMAAGVGIGHSVSFHLRFSVQERQTDLPSSRQVDQGHVQRAPVPAGLSCRSKECITRIYGRRNEWCSIAVLVVGMES